MTNAFHTKGITVPAAQRPHHHRFCPGGCIPVPGSSQSLAPSPGEAASPDLGFGVEDLCACPEHPTHEQQVKLCDCEAAKSLGTLEAPFTSPRSAQRKVVWTAGVTGRSAVKGPHTTGDVSLTSVYAASMSSCREGIDLGRN
ncbi:hypothetical protein P7K49_005593 [Saguinus oedipus]|uniref:Uncharacterized protein n=1 Tax=Saguinus oedipus TaxID=9490 RepID=A0ABQ9W2H7_SAGOE|nr:hypothetical protein P7K49_005593 [Saguinus oedipus]